MCKGLYTFNYNELGSEASLKTSQNSQEDTYAGASFSPKSRK